MAKGLGKSDQVKILNEDFLGWDDLGGPNAITRGLNGRRWRWKAADVREMHTGPASGGLRNRGDEKGFSPEPQVLGTS